MLVCLLVYSWSLGLVGRSVLAKPAAEEKLEEDSDMFSTFTDSETVKNCKVFPIDDLLADKGFKRECEKELRPDIVDDKTNLKKNVLDYLDDNQFPILCFAAMEAVTAACAKTDLGAVDIKQNNKNFCSHRGSISIPENCNLENCDVIKVLTEVLEDEESCKEVCIKRNKPNAACKILSATLTQLFPGKDPHTNTTSPAHPNDIEKTTVDENRRSTNRTELSITTPKTKEATGSKEAEPAPPGLKRSNATTQDAQAPATTTTSLTESKEEEDGGDGAGAADDAAEAGKEEDDSENVDEEKEEEDGDTAEETPEPKEVEEEAGDTAKETLEPEEKEEPAAKAGEKGDEDVEVEQVEASPEQQAVETDAEAQVDQAQGGTDMQQTQEASKKEEMDDEETIIIGNGEDTMTSGVYVEDNSSFMAYFLLTAIVCIIAYLVFHNKQKILALVLEGRRSSSTRRRSGGREYRKLDTNVEDTMDLNRESNLRQVIY